MSGNKSYDKGWRFEDRMRKEFAPYGKCDRAHASGAWTGEADLSWHYNGQIITFDCKSGDGWEGKRHRARLEKADVCLDGPDRKVALAILPVPKLKHLMGLKPTSKAELGMAALIANGYTPDEAAAMVGLHGVESDGPEE